MCGISEPIEQERPDGSVNIDGTKIWPAADVGFSLQLHHSFGVKRSRV